MHPSDKIIKNIMAACKNKVMIAYETPLPGNLVKSLQAAVILYSSHSEQAFK